MDTTQLANAALVAAFLAFIVPPIVSFLRARRASPETIGLLLFGVCLAGAALSLLVTDQLFRDPLPPDALGKAKYFALMFLGIFALAVTFYKGFWATFGAKLTAALEDAGPQLGAEPPVALGDRFGAASRRE
jgi:hypothetical protein